MKHYSRHVQGWFMWTNVYANRTKAEGEMADFVEIAFRPDRDLAVLKGHIDLYLSTLPDALQKKFTVSIIRGGTIRLVHLDKPVPVYRLSVRYKTRWVISISEPSTKEYHDDKRKSEDIH